MRRSSESGRRRYTPGTLIRRYGKVTGIIIVAIGIALTLYTISARLFVIKQVEVIGANIQITLDRSRFYDQLLFFPTEEYRKQLLSEYPQISGLTIGRRLPDTLILKVTLKTPIARLETRSRPVLIDDQAMIISDLRPGHDDLPYIRIPVDDPGDGNRIRDMRVVAGVRLLNEVRGSIPVEYVSDYDKHSLRAKAGKTDIFFPQEGDIMHTAATLQTLFSRFRMKGTMPSIIDVRYQKPIITY